MQREVTIQDENEVTGDEMETLKDFYCPWRLPAYLEIELYKNIDKNWTFSCSYREETRE